MMGAFRRRADALFELIDALYGPSPVVAGKRPRGRPKVHGDKFRLKSPHAPERQVTWSFNQAMHGSVRGRVATSRTCRRWLARWCESSS